MCYIAQEYVNMLMLCTGFTITFLAFYLILSSKVAFIWIWEAYWKNLINTAMSDLETRCLSLFSEKICCPLKQPKKLKKGILLSELLILVW